MKKTALALLLSFVLGVVLFIPINTVSAAYDSSILAGRWNVNFDDGKTGWLTLGAREQSGYIPGRLFAARAIIEYPPGTKRTGVDYNNGVTPFPVQPTIELGDSFGLSHEVSPRNGQGMHTCQLVAINVLICKTNLSEQGGRIMQYPGGYPFQFMGSGNFTATK